MAKRIIVNISPEETRIAILVDGLFTEVAVERPNTENIVGNIYKGKIRNVLPGMQAVFVDIGESKNAFLYASEVGHGEIVAKQTQTSFCIGQDVLVQITKEAIGKKGPRGTFHLTLPGRYVVLLPSVDYIGISRRIADEAERSRLKQLALQTKPAGMGLIVRTVAEGKSEAELYKDIQYLHNLWKALQVRYKREQAPQLLFRDVDLIIRIVRDYLTEDVDEFIIDNQEAYNRVCDLLRYISPDTNAKVKFYNGAEDIFSAHGLDDAISEIAKRKVMLACGGYLVIDHTEALTVIDVNTGSFIGTTNLADTVFHTNCEAAIEIARQIRLRDIGGIIIVDFIDMDDEVHRNTLLQILQDKVRQDRTKTQVLGLTALGLVEITRKKARRNLDGLLFSDCPLCGGRGRIESPETVAVKIRRQLRRIARQPRCGGSFIIQVHPQVASVFQRKGEQVSLEKELAMSIIIESVSSMHPETFSILQQPAKK